MNSAPKNTRPANRAVEHLGNDRQAAELVPPYGQGAEQVPRYVEVTFDCMPLRTVPRVDVPLDASPKLAAKILRVKAALEKHGSLNSYYLHNAKCTYHLTNDPQQGMMEFDFEGVLLTDEQDMLARSCDLHVSLRRETCSWLNQSIVQWLSETVSRNVLIDFNRYIAQGDLSKTLERIEQTQQASDDAGGYVGMYL